MAVVKAVEALKKMREHVDLGTEDDIHMAASYALIYLAEHTASEVGKHLINTGVIERRSKDVAPDPS